MWYRRLWRRPQVLLLVKPEREFSFQAFSVLSPGCRRSLMELQERNATGLLLAYYLLSTLTLWVISSSFIALYIFCQPLPHSSPVQHCLPRSRCCLLNTHQTHCVTYIQKLILLAAFPISSWWSLHFQDAQVKHFSIILVPISHTISNPSGSYHSCPFKTCPESNCFHWYLLDPSLQYHLLIYNSLLIGLPCLPYPTTVCFQ